MSDSYDPRIAMVPGYRPPPPRPYKYRHPWRYRLFVLLGSIVALIALLAFVEVLLGIDATIPRLKRVSDYRPKQITRFVATSGEVVAEVIGERRSVIPLDKQPANVTHAVLKRQEPDFMTRPALGEAQMIQALVAAAKGEREAPPISLQLVRRLSNSTDTGGIALIRQWIAARRLEHDLGRAEILGIYLNQVPFGSGVFGIEEGARSLFGVSAGSLVPEQAKALAEASNRTDGPAWKQPVPTDAVGCGKAAVAKLAERMDPEAMAHLGATIVTTCDPAVSRIVEKAIAQQGLKRLDLSAAAVVVRLPSYEVAAIVDGPARPIGNLWAPLVIGAAISSLKWTPISPLDEHGTTLRFMATYSPTSAANALLTAGVSPEAVHDLATRAGIHSGIDASGLSKGTALVTPLEIASVLATFANAGQYRVPQLIRSVGDLAESEGSRTVLQSVSPEVAWLTTSLFQPPAAARGRLSKRVSTHSSDAWVAQFTPDIVVVVWLGFADGHTLPPSGEGENAAIAIGHAIFTGVLEGKVPTPFSRPTTLVSRHVDAAGKLLPSASHAGYEEWFVPGSLPREEVQLPPEPPPRAPSKPEPEEAAPEAAQE